MSERQERVENALLHITDADCGCGDEGVLDGVWGETRWGGASCGRCAERRQSDAYVCGFGVEGGVVAAVFAPLQVFEGVYDVTTAMRRGTMFEALDKPFYGDGREVDCRGREK